MVFIHFDFTSYIEMFLLLEITDYIENYSNPINSRNNLENFFGNVNQKISFEKLFSNMGRGVKE